MCTVVIIACIVVLGSVYSLEYFFGLEPCELCIYQRWPWWAAFLLSISTRLPYLSYLLISRLISLAGFSIIISGVIALYHVGIEYDWWSGPSTCTNNGALPNTLSELRASGNVTLITSCDKVPWSLFGFSLAFYNLILSIGLGVSVLVLGVRKLN
ncbi:MAG: disulfide bond formation protein B [Pseudomonadota bacterium]|nr:disulfide bond formation protein B [Pseudomonadota bacterium]